MIVQRAGINLLTITRWDFERWVRAELVRIDQLGSGSLRDYPPGELRAALALDSLRRLGGAVPSRGGDMPLSVAQLRRTVTELARSHEAGTAHEITTPVPWIRHILIVPTIDHEQ